MMSTNVLRHESARYQLMQLAGPAEVCSSADKIKATSTDPTIAHHSNVSTITDGAASAAGEGCSNDINVSMAVATAGASRPDHWSLD